MGKNRRSLSENFLLNLRLNSNLPGIVKFYLRLDHPRIVELFGDEEGTFFIPCSNDFPFGIMARSTFRIDAFINEELRKTQIQTLAKELYDALPYFNGEGPNAVKDFELFDGIVRNWLPSIPADNQDFFARRIAQKLYGRAKRLVEHVELGSVEDILLVLGRKLKRGDPYITWQKNLAAAAPKDTENIEDFYYRLSEMVRLIELNAPEADRAVVKCIFEKTAATTLYEYLPDFLRCLCKIRRAETLNDMYLAIENDAYRRPERRRSMRDDGLIPGESLPPSVESHRRPGQDGNRHYPQMPRSSRDYDDRGNYRELPRTLAYQEYSQSPRTNAPGY
ncbi:hypothetical protein KQX54_001622 [Cotesia glomerata]|uniref:Retrotransposon gag domain-containing protein n=1 Tax=Cotesia glomerata TaxID=32391 RepID=A0AAV7IB06_COTGL|nr:hypothetical protein KQX54_001622 [Cotesia glomerata]